MHVPIESKHLSWLGGLIGLYALAKPPDSDEFRALLPSLALVRYPKAAEIIREGEVGRELFVIYSGEVSVNRGGKHIADLGPGALIGEMGLVLGAPRTATVSAVRECEAFVIPSIEKLLAQYPALRAFLLNTAQQRMGELKDIVGVGYDTTLPGDPAQGGAGIGPDAPGPLASADAARSGALKRLVANRYELRSLIDEGGMGKVYAGFDRSLERTVAVKQVRAHGSDMDARERFMKEARAIARLTHPFIVAVHDIVDEVGDLYLVMEYVDGKPISGILEEKRRFTLAECRAVFTHVCQAVACAHWNHVLHRDLKPANIMIDRLGYAKVMDFGLAREAKDLFKLARKEISGTPYYMAPEQHWGESGTASDIYSLGVCLYEMLTGVVPFKGPDFVTQKEREDYAAPSTILPELRGGGVDELVARALSADPGKRILGALEFLEALKQTRGA